MDISTGENIQLRKLDALYANTNIVLKENRLRVVVFLPAEKKKIPVYYIRIPQATFGTNSFYQTNSLNVLKMVIFERLNCPEFSSEYKLFVEKFFNDILLSSIAWYNVVRLRVSEVVFFPLSICLFVEVFCARVDA